MCGFFFHSVYYFKKSLKKNKKEYQKYFIYQPETGKLQLLPNIFIPMCDWLYDRTVSICLTSELRTTNELYS